MKTYLSKYKRSAIIGYWKKGLGHQRIAELTLINVERVLLIIETYEKAAAKK